MNKAYFTEVNNGLAQINERLDEILAEIYGPVPTPSQEARETVTSPCINELISDHTKWLSQTHEKVSTLCSIILGK